MVFSTWEYLGKGIKKYQHDSALVNIIVSGVLGRFNESITRSKLIDQMYSYVEHSTQGDGQDDYDVDTFNENENKILNGSE